jgi:formylglycine-generating enzyme required for sulfatase activity
MYAGDVRTARLIASLSFVALGASTSVYACSPFSGGDRPSAAVDAGADSGVSAHDGGADAGLGCPGLHGPRMVLVGDVCIDSMEVTQSQFAELLAEPKLTVVFDAGVCVGAVRPSAADLVCDGTPPTGVNLPQTCVTLCDAELFCAFAGKRLCGARSAVDPAAPLGADSDEWTHACALSPSGPSGCNIDNAGALRPVGGGCEGPAGVFDLIGNAAERTSILVGNTNSQSAGDSYKWKSAQGGDTCLAVDDDPINTRHIDLGFRCCATPR